LIRFQKISFYDLINFDCNFIQANLVPTMSYTTENVAGKINIP